MKNDSASVRTPDTIRDELKVLLAEAESFMSSSTSHPLPEPSVNLSTRIGAAGDRVASIYTRAKDRVAAEAASANTSIHAHPYQSLAIALGVGVVAGAITGVLVGRRRA